MAKKQVMIGWREYVDLPDLGVYDLEAKIDTGARSSALHVKDVMLLPDNRIRFRVVETKFGPGGPIVSAPLRRQARVRGSHGVASTRYFILTRMILGGREKLVEVSLINREKMRYRMLVGRTALGSHYCIHPAKLHMLNKGVSS